MQRESGRKGAAGRGAVVGVEEEGGGGAEEGGGRLWGSRGCAIAEDGCRLGRMGYLRDASQTNFAGNMLMFCGRPEGRRGDAWGVGWHIGTELNKLIETPDLSCTKGHEMGLSRDAWPHNGEEHMDASAERQNKTLRENCKGMGGRLQRIARCDLHEPGGQRLPQTPTQSCRPPRKYNPETA